MRIAAMKRSVLVLAVVVFAICLQLGATAASNSGSLLVPFHSGTVTHNIVASVSTTAPSCAQTGMSADFNQSYTASVIYSADTLHPGMPLNAGAGTIKALGFAEILDSTGDQEQLFYDNLSSGFLNSSGYVASSSGTQSAPSVQNNSHFFQTAGDYYLHTKGTARDEYTDGNNQLANIDLSDKITVQPTACH
jgi:hypothetical protein